MEIMQELLHRIFLKNWPRKLVALLTAIIIWFIVSQTLTITRTIVDVHVRIINLPPDKTVLGLLPNGLLNKRISVTVTGNKSVVGDIEPSDMEVVINADDHKESWIATITKRNIVSLNQAIDLHKNLTEVTANDLFIKLSKLITEEVPVIITKPIGEPPKGYQFLDIWPKYLIQRVSGPEEQVKELKQKQLELTFNLNRITQSDLDALFETQKQDEISFPIPEAWKKVAIPFKDNALEPLNDPRAEFLRLDFLKQELIPLGIEIPIMVFFPLKYGETINPEAYSLATNEIVHQKNGITTLSIPLYVQDVSQLFLEVVRNNLLLIVVAAPKNVSKFLPWSVEFIDHQALEDAFISASMQQEKNREENFTKYSQQAIRDRFRSYLHGLVFFTESGKPLQLQAQLNHHQIKIDKL
jgi:hypothetical protein